MTPKNPRNGYIMLVIMMFIGVFSTINAHADVYYDTKLIRVIDGDTIHIQVVVWPNTIIDTKLRIYGIDTPEKRSKCQAEKDLSAEATAFTTKMLINGFSVGFPKNGKYAGRTIGKVHIPLKTLKTHQMSDQSIHHYMDTGLPPSLGDLLIEEGLAVPYFGKKKKDWAADLCPINFESLPIMKEVLKPKRNMTTILPPFDASRPSVFHKVI